MRVSIQLEVPWSRTLVMIFDPLKSVHNKDMCFWLRNFYGGRIFLFVLKATTAVRSCARSCRWSARCGCSSLRNKTRPVREKNWAF